MLTNPSLLLGFYPAVIDLINFTSEKINALSQLRDAVRDIILTLENRGEKLAEVNIQERIGLPIVSDADTQNVVQAVLPPKETERRLQLEQLSRKVIEATAPSDTATSLSLFFKPSLTPAAIPPVLDQVVDKQIADLMVTLRGSAVRRLMEMGSKTQLIAYLRTLENQSNLLLPLNLNDGYFNNAPQKLNFIIAYHQPAGNDPYVQAFGQLLAEARFTANANVVQLPASEQHQVIFMTEYASFPLRLINDLTANNYQFAYQRRGQAGNADFLHTNKAITLTDILPPPPEIVSEVQELFFKCLGLGIFQLEGSNLVLRNERGKELIFGNDWAALIDQLSWIQIQNRDQQGQTLTDLLRQQFKKKMEWLVNNSREGHNYCQKIETLIEEIRKCPQDHVNFPMVPIVAGTEITSLTGIARKGILKELIEEIENRIKEKETKPLSPNPELTTAEIDHTANLPPSDHGSHGSNEEEETNQDA